MPQVEVDIKQVKRVAEQLASWTVEVSDLVISAVVTGQQTGESWR